MKIAHLPRFLLPLCVLVAARAAPDPQAPRAGTAASLVLAPIDASEIAVRGEGVILLLEPIAPDGSPMPAAEAAGADAPVESIVRASTETGTSVDLRCELILAEPPRTRTPLTTWLGAPAVWRAPAKRGESEAIAAAIASGRAAWVAVGLENSGLQPASLTVGGRRVALEWRDPPPARALPERAPPSAIEPALALLCADPLARWRGALLAQRFGVRPPRVAEAPAAIAALADRVERPWRAGMARLREADAAVADRVLLALTALVALDDGTVVPAWPEGADSLAALRAVLLDTSLRGASLAERALAWLSSVPAGAAWIADEGGTPGGVSLCLASLAPERVAASVLVDGVASAGAAEITTVAPLSGVTLTLPVARRQDGQPSTLDIRVGEWSAQRAVVSAPIPASPPGVRLGPLIPAWTLRDWLGGAPGASDAAWATDALLQRRIGGKEWEIVVQCRTPSGAPVDAADDVRVFLGGGEKPAVIRVSARGYAVLESTAAARPEPIAVSRGPDGWIAAVPLPTSLIPRGLLPLAIERVHERGGRWSWPRPALPWQATPGRVIVDLTAWQGIETLGH